MSTPSRPQFHQDQILEDRHLTALNDHARGVAARHARQAHSPGIVEGLNLELRDPVVPGSAKELYLTAGTAVDLSGREVVVATEQRIAEDAFRQANVADPAADATALYPVFLVGLDEQAPVNEGFDPRCGERKTDSILEGYEIRFGRVGDAADLDERLPPEPSAGPADPGEDILLGFVNWQDSPEGFSGVETSAGKARRQYAGARGVELAAPQGGVVHLRSAPRGTDGAPALALDQEKGELQFGPQDSAGAINPVLTVNASGDLTVVGRMLGAGVGMVQAESGLVSDGMLLPLPQGITQQQVDDCEMVLHGHLSPYYNEPATLSAPAANHHWIAHPIELRLENRRVYCRIAWAETDLATGNVASSQILGGPCTYLALAYATEKEEGS